jgi:peptidoglycan/xylan/chitin deacetylase (PgdA/CDA1 family)
LISGLSFYLYQQRENNFKPPVPSVSEPSAPSVPKAENNSAVVNIEPPVEQPVEYTGTSIPILMYHEIGTGPNSLYVPTDKFRTQMNYLYKSGYHSVTMAKAQEMLFNGKIPAKTIVITFDDGYSSVYTRAWPIMQEFGFTGTVYVCTEFSGRANYLTWAEIKNLQCAGIEIGSHTKNHIDLKTADTGRQTQEIAGSKKALEEHLGVPVKSFCYPTGTYNEITPQLVKEAGYTSAVTVAYGQATSKNNLYLIPRVRVPGWASLEQFASSFR